MNFEQWMEMLSSVQILQSIACFHFSFMTVDSALNGLWQVLYQIYPTRSVIVN